MTLRTSLSQRDCAQDVQTIMLSSLPTSWAWIFLFYQQSTTFHFSKRQQTKKKERKKQPQHPQAPQSSVSCSKMSQSNTDFCNSVKAAVRFWSSLSQQPQNHHKLAGPPFPSAHRPAQFPALSGNNWAQPVTPVTSKELWKKLKKFKKSSCFPGTVWFRAHLAIARRFYQEKKKTSSPSKPIFLKWSPNPCWKS